MEPEAFDALEDILDELRTRRPLLPVGERPSPDTENVVAPIVAAGEAMKKAGERAFGRYIVSMSEAPSDVLEILLVAREAGVHVLPVPLFETLRDLQRAPQIMRELLQL